MMKVFAHVLISFLLVGCSWSKSSVVDQQLTLRGAGEPIASGDQQISRRAINCQDQFFANAQPPVGFRSSMNDIKRICTKLPQSDQFYYAVMFDEGRGIAEYCAYFLTEQDAARVDELGPPPFLGPFRQSNSVSKQGNDELYSKASGLVRGYLVPPHILSFDGNHLSSTHTYTNIVPVYPALLNNGWSEYESDIREIATRFCCKKGSGGKLYLLSGTSDIQIRGAMSGFPKVPLPEYFPDGSNPNKIVKPQMLWTAGCCIKQELTLSFAVTGNNVNDAAKTYVSVQTVKFLQDVLTEGVKSKGGPVQLFPGRPACSAPANHAEIYFSALKSEKLL